MGPPRIIFGAGTVGMGFDTPEAVSEVLEFLKKHDIQQIDTAARYPPGYPGLSESLLGEANAGQKGFALDTKILTFAADGSGELAKSAIEKSLEASFHRLKVDSVNVLHCHRPDPSTPLMDQAHALNALHKQGKFKQLGVSNFSPNLLHQFIKICKKFDYIRPTVYQGDYNAITRGMEKELLPLLLQYGIAFHAFRPLASGFLTGKSTAGTASGTRFSDEHPLGKALQKMYKCDVNDAAIEKLDKAAQRAGMPLEEAALRWIFYHSRLTEDDGVIIGASKLSQLQANLESIQKGPLDEGRLPEKELLDVFEEVWKSLEKTRGHIV